jgi:hypothetical protein
VYWFGCHKLLLQLDCRLLSALVSTNDNGITNCNRITKTTSFTSENHSGNPTQTEPHNPNQSKPSQTKINHPNSTHSDPKQQKPNETKQSKPTNQPINQSNSQPTKPGIYVFSLGFRVAKRGKRRYKSRGIVGSLSE